MEFGGGTSTSITVGGRALIVGQSYLTQLFFTDLRKCCSSRVMTYGDGEANSVNVTASGAPGSFGQFAVGSFVESSLVLMTWTPFTVVNSIAYNADGTMTVSMRSNESLTAVRQFLRVRVSAR